MQTVGFLHMKGGVGKTSSVFHLSGVFAEQGRRVLLVDNDPQASLTQGFLGPTAAAAVAPAASVAALYPAGADPVPEALLVRDVLPGVDLVPGSIAAVRYNRPVPDAFWDEGQEGLRLFLEQLAGQYELALIDCPPNLHLCSWAALVAAQAVVVPLQPEDFGSQGLAPLHASVAAARAAANPALTLTGYLLSMYDKRLAVHLTYEERLRARYGALVFSAVVPRAKDFVEAVTMRRPVTVTKPRSAASRAVRAVAAELLTRLGMCATNQERGAA